MFVAVSFVLFCYRMFANRRPNQTSHGIADTLAQFFTLTVFLGLGCGSCCNLCRIISRGASAVGCVAVHSAVRVCGGGLRNARNRQQGYKYNERIFHDLWYRLLYIQLDGVVYVLHCFRKKTNETTQRDINTAQLRLTALKKRLAEQKKKAKRGSK